MLFGTPTKHIRLSNDTTHVLEPQRFVVHAFWAFSTAATARVDGQDLRDETVMPEGSRVTSHKMDILISPETIEPQQIYMGRIKLSFHDIYATAIIGGRGVQASYLDTTIAFTADTNPITPHLRPDDVSSTKIVVRGSNTANQEIGNAGSGLGIQDWMLDDHIKHFISVKKVTVFDQRPLMGERFQRIPAKVKRINEGTFYGLFIFNDSPRGGTPADTQVTINIKDNITEMAI